jgi:hypothetical protein
MVYQAGADVSVYNGPDTPYLVKSRVQPDGSQVQLVGLDPANLDAFSRLRISQPVTLFEAMGFTDPRAVEGRRKLSGILFS